jgi:hypothetical protein
MRALAGAQRRACRGDSGEELRVVLQAILQPVILGLEADEDPGGTSMTGDEDLLISGGAKIA